MHPVVRATVVVALFWAVGSLAREPAVPAPIVVQPTKAHGVTGLPAPCGPHTVPEGDVCIPVPSSVPLAGARTFAAPASTQTGEHPDKQGQGAQTYDHVPRLPDRPAEFASYALPVGERGKAPEILSGYDLDLPAAAQRHGVGFKTHGHGGVDFAAAKGAPVVAVELEHQEGPAEILFVGELFGTTVVTAHAVREGDHLETIVLLHGHLEHVEPGLAVHGRVGAGAPIGAVGDSGSPGIVHLHFEARRIRQNVDLASLDAKKLLDPTVSLATDPRNVLSLLAK